jgi:dihydroxyacetone kinase
MMDAAADVAGAMRRAGEALIEGQEALAELDRAIGDGDLGITAAKVGEVLVSMSHETPEASIGDHLIRVGSKVNVAAASTMGTLMATALMRAGRAVKGKSGPLNVADLVQMLAMAEAGVRELGKAQVGDKTIVDVLHPASIAFSQAIAEGKSLQFAAWKLLEAASKGAASVVPLRSKAGRAGWIGDRTIGKKDPGCEAVVIVLQAIARTS